MGNVVGFQKLYGGDEGDGADRTVGGGDGEGVKVGSETAQEPEAQPGNDDGQRDGAAQAEADGGGQTRVGEGETTFEPEGHQEVER